MDISIIICSYNRCHNLAECFDHLTQQNNVDDLNWEVVLVDNNSNDDTRSVVRQLASELSINIRYVFEPEQGLSAARNKGIEEAKGTYLLFIDDDIRVTRNWLASIVKTFKEFDCDVVGGRIHVESPASFPAWIRPDMYGFLGHQDFGEMPHVMDGINEFPFGGNMAVHRRVFEKIGNFNTNMGRKGEGRKKNELFKGEETDFFHRLANAGGSFYYQPKALVMHKILPHQLKKRFFLTLHTNAGILQAKNDHTRHNRRLAGIPLFVFPQFFRSIKNYIVLFLEKGPDYAFRQQMNIYYFWGMLQGYFSRNN